MKHFYRLGLVSWIVCCIPLLPLRAQDIEQLGVKKGVKAGGSISFNSVGYLVDGIPSRRDPFTWFASGNLTLNVFGYATPFSFSYSNSQRSYSQPFNQLSFAPQYKWIKTYLGYSSMTFSPYTLAGYTFLGGGVELSPGHWRIGAMAGRLKKPVPFNPADSLNQAGAAFRRMGYGLKIGYEGDGGSLGMSLFTASDDLRSIPYVLPNSELTPQRNVALSIGGRKQVGRLSLAAEYALSALTKDTRAAARIESDSLGRGGANLLRGLLPQTATTRYYDAFNASLGYQSSWYGCQLKYERIAPEYSTLGAYYFNNDLENITVAPSVRLLKSTVNLTANVGLQRNNLDQARTATTRRFVSSVNLSFVPNAHWNVAVAHSNFSTFTRMRPQNDPYFRNNLDTLNFYQITNSTNGTVGYSFGTKERRQSVLLNGSYQRASDQAAYQGGSNLSDFYTGNLSYSYTRTPSNTTVAVSVNYYTAKSVVLSNRYWGPTLSLSQAFRKKTLKVALSSSYNQSVANGVAGGDVWNTRSSLTYSPKNTGSSTSGSEAARNGGSRSGSSRNGSSRHNLNLSLNTLRRFRGITPSQPSGFTEWTTTAGYTYTF